MSPRASVQSRGQARRVGAHGGCREQVRAGSAEAGMTLIELMIALLLAIMLSGGLFYMMAGQKQTYATQMSTMTSQENLWGAMEYLQSQIRKAGYGFGVCGTNVKITTEALGLPAGSMNNINALDIYTNYNSFTKVIDGTDSFELRYADDAGGGFGSMARLKDKWINPVNAPASATGSANLKKDDLVILCSPGGEGVVLQLTTKDPQYIPGQKLWQLLFNPSSIYNPPGGKGLPELFQGTYIARFGSTADTHKFAIDNTRDPPMLVTWTRSDKADLQVVADGIEDMQVAYACDVDKDGVLEEGTTVAQRRTDEWANNVATDTAPDCNFLNPPILAVRVTLIARTAGATESKSGYRPAAEDHAAGTAAHDMTQTGGTGTYGRSVLTATTQPRNIRKVQ